MAMKPLKGVNFFLLIIVFVLGKRLIEHFDPVTKTFAKPAIDILYGVVLVLSLVFLVREWWMGRNKASAGE